MVQVGTGAVCATCRIINWQLAPDNRSDIRTFERSQHFDYRLAVNGETTNFTVGQFASGCGAGEIRLDGLMIYYLHNFDMYFDGDMTITSGYRSPTHDRNVGGSGSGQHTQGRAVDFWIEGYTANALRALALELGFNDWFGFTYNINWRTIHIDTRGR